MTVATTVNLRVEALHRETQGFTGTSKLAHVAQHLASYATGTSDSQLDEVYQISATASASADTYDLLNNLVDNLDGSTVSFVECCLIMVSNKSTTAGECLLVGGGSNPFTGMWGASGDIIKVGPGGAFFWSSPIDGAAPVAGTGDILTIDPGANNIAYDLIILGRSA